MNTSSSHSIEHIVGEWANFFKNFIVRDFVDAISDRRAAVNFHFHFFLVRCVRGESSSVCLSHARWLRWVTRRWVDEISSWIQQKLFGIQTRLWRRVSAFQSSESSREMMTSRQEKNRTNEIGKIFSVDKGARAVDGEGRGCIAHTFFSSLSLAFFVVQQESASLQRMRRSDAQKRSFLGANVQGILIEVSFRLVWSTRWMCVDMHSIRMKMKLFVDLFFFFVVGIAKWDQRFGRICNGKNERMFNERGIWWVTGSQKNCRWNEKLIMVWIHFASTSSDPQVKQLLQQKENRHLCRIEKLRIGFMLS